MRGILIFAYILFPLVANASATRLSKEGACEALLRVLPRASGLIELDARETRRAYERLRHFRNEVLGYPRNDEWTIDEEGTFSILQARTDSKAAARAAGRIRNLERSYEEGCFAVSRCFGQIFDGPEDLLLLSGQLTLMDHNISTRESRDLKIEGLWYGGLTAAGTSLLAASYIFPGLGLHWSGVALLVPPIYYALKNLTRWRPRFQASTFILQRIAIETRHRDWLYIHAESKVPASILRSEKNWITTTAEEIGPEAYVESDFVAYVDETELGERTSHAVSFIRFWNNSAQK